MADENLEANSEPATEAVEQELSPIEQRAAEQGWVPQEQWQGDPDDWRPAKEFVDRGELFKKIDELKRENKAIKQGHEALMKHHADVKKLAYEEALRDLKARKAEALAEGDHAAVVELDDKIDEHKEKMREVVQEAKQAVAPTTQVDPIFDPWVTKNKWYNTDRAMKAYADEVARETFLRGTTDKEAILQEVEKAVKKEFSHKFENPRRATAPAVEGTPNRSSRQRETDPTTGMSDAERQMMNKILRVTPGLTKEQYLKEYMAVKSRGV